MDDTEALIDTEQTDNEPGEDGEVEEEKQESTGNDKKKIKRSKSYTTAKALNDREQRRLKVKLEFYDKEFKITSNKLNIEQAALKRELRNINPDIQVRNLSPP